MGKPYFLCKKFVKKRESYQVRLDFFGSTFGVWWGLFFATWRGRALAESAVRRGGTALGVEVQLLSGSGGCFQKSIINSPSKTFDCYPVQK